MVLIKALTGLDYDLWLVQRARDVEHELFAERAGVLAPPVGASTRMYALMRLLPDGRHEAVLRHENGSVCMVRDEAFLGHWLDHDIAASTAAYLYGCPRGMVANDLERPDVLVCARDGRAAKGSILTWSGEPFGLQRDIRTALLAPGDWPGWPALIEQVQRDYQYANWVTFTERRPFDPTLRGPADASSDPTGDESAGSRPGSRSCAQSRS